MVKIIFFGNTCNIVAYSEVFMMSVVQPTKHQKYPNICWAITKVSELKEI